jgi:hypothetical protein
MVADLPINQPLTDDAERFLDNRGLEMFEPRTIERVSQWVERCLIIPPPQTQAPGQFSTDGREYCREPLDDFGDWDIADEVLCFGSQTGKTTIIIGGVAFIVCTSPTGILWAMPSIDLARSFSETRWVPIVEASPEMARRKPGNRHNFKKLQQQIGGSILNFVGTNSPANLAGRPAQVVFLDEVDKFNEGGNKEADAVNLAEQRTKSFANPKRVKTSTPTLSSGLIWTEFKKGDQRRYFVPCPHCGKFIILAWSESFTVFDKLGCEAYVKWDKEAKGKNGAWDMDRVERSARFVCPHCAADILDKEKTIMNRNGEWRPTAKAPASFRSRHLPSLYAATPETSVGRLAVKFLQAKESLLGLRGFINGDLAEPFESQDLSTIRCEIVTPDEDCPAGVTQTLHVDCQQNAPHYYWVVMAWMPGVVRIAKHGFCDTIEELRAVQVENKIRDRCVSLDIGWNREVIMEQCARFGQIAWSKDGRERGAPLHLGWTPWVGAKEQNFKDKQLRAQFPVKTEIEVITAFGQRLAMPILMMNDKGLKDMLAALRRGEKKSVRLEFAKSVADDPQFWRHLDAEILTRVLKGRRWVEAWDLRSDRWPNHWLDCVKSGLGYGLRNKLMVDAALSRMMNTVSA